MNWFTWAKTRPTVIINLIGLLIILVGGGIFFVYQATRPLDVLQDWTIEVSDARGYRTIDGVKTAVFHPGDSLVFTSKSTKVVNTNGITSRTIVCEATDRLKEREIQLDNIPAGKPAGENLLRENAVVVPDVSQFKGLPRNCRLVIDITYANVALWRNHTEHAETSPFIVEEERLDPSSIRKQIESLTDRIKQLEDRLAEKPVAVTPPKNETELKTKVVQSPPANNDKPANNNKPADSDTDVTAKDEPSALSKLPIVGNLLEDLGL